MGVEEEGKEGEMAVEKEGKEGEMAVEEEGKEGKMAVEKEGEMAVEKEGKGIVEHGEDDVLHEPVGLALRHLKDQLGKVVRIGLEQVE